MANVFNTYDPSRVSFTFKGMKITQFQDGTFIKVSRASDGFFRHTGALGDVTRTRNLDRTGHYEITLMAQCSDNDVLADLAEEDEQFGTAWGPCQVVDHNGNMEAHSVVAWIRKQPELERAKESGGVVWMFDCADVEIQARGNVIADNF